MQDNAHEVIDKTIGGLATAAGGLGLTIQWFTNFGSLILIVLNIALAAGGLYLLWLRIKRARKDDKK